jgi:hypothetical protein
MIFSYTINVEIELSIFKTKKYTFSFGVPRSARAEATVRAQRDSVGQSLLSSPGFT